MTRSFSFLLDLSTSALCYSATPNSTTEIGFEMDKNLRHGTLNYGRTKKSLLMGLVGFEKSVWLMQGDRSIILIITACI